MSKKKRPYCLTIAGFDPSGGAGILADIKTFEQHRTLGLAVITANTIQTEDAFISTNWISSSIILEQISVLFSRYTIDYVKIGLVENGELLLDIITTIRKLNPKAFILWDPILSATAGGTFNENRFKDNLPVLLANLDFITPNLNEATILFDKERLEAISSNNQISIYLKGGHSEENKGKDVLYTPSQIHPFKSHITGEWDKHGTGCILSAALLSHFALDYPLVKSCLKSKRYIEQILTSNSSRLAYHKR